MAASASVISPMALAAHQDEAGPQQQDAGSQEAIRGGLFSVATGHDETRHTPVERGPGGGMDAAVYGQVTDVAGYSRRRAVKGSGQQAKSRAVKRG